MKILFAKYNSERLPQYQIVTKIAQDEKNGKRYAIKEPLCVEAQEHIKTIFQNYELLKNKYDVNLVKPQRDGDNVVFEMAEGISLEKLMLHAIDDGDIQLFERYVEQFISFVDGFVSKRNVTFEPCEKFKSIFGEWIVDEPQDIIEIANVDLIFGNIFVADNKFTLIDYEWIFRFDMPKSYIIWRAFYVFKIYHNIDIATYALDSFFVNHDKFTQMDEQFSSFVHGEEKKYFLNRKVLKANIPIDMTQNTLTCKNNYFCQLFIDQGNGFLEENSMKLPVCQNTEIQEFIFDLSKRSTIKALRLSPFNDSCVIEIESLHVKTKEREIDLLPLVQSNAMIHHGKSYFFTTEDSQIYFDGLNEAILHESQILTVNIRYPHIGGDALYVSAKQAKTELLVVYESSSWKITKPLRKIKQILQGE